MHKLAILVLSLLLLAGCTSRYPSKWAEPVSVLPQGCSSLAGIYHDKPTAGPNSWSLSNILSGNHEARIKADRVELIVPKTGAMKMVAYSGDSVVSETQYSEQDKTLSCNQSGAELTVLNGPWIVRDSWGVSRIKVTLGKTEDGYLILKTDAAGLVFAYDVIPIPAAVKSWYRFRQYVCEDSASIEKQVGTKRDTAFFREHGNVCYWSRNYDRAIENYTAAIDLNRANHSEGYMVHMNRGMAWLRKTNYEQAVADYDEAARLEPEYVQAYSWRGDAEFYLGRYEAAAADFSESLRLDRNQPPLVLWQYIAQSRAGKQRLTADELVRNAENIKKNTWESHVIDLFTGQIDPAALFKAAENPNSILQRDQTCDAEFYVGEWYLLNNRPQDARTMFEREANECPEFLSTYAGSVSELRRIAGGDKSKPGPLVPQ